MAKTSKGAKKFANRGGGGNAVKKNLKADSKRGKASGKGKGKGKASGKGGSKKGSGKGSKKGDKKAGRKGDKKEDDEESEDGAKRSKSPGKGKGKGKGTGKGIKTKAKAEAPDKDKPKRGVKRARPADEEEEDGKKKKRLTPRMKRRKEVTTLYSELINPGKEDKVDVVGKILKVLEERETNLFEYCCKEIGSRVMQACLKWGSIEQRRSLLTKLRDQLGKLATDRFGHVVVLKLLSYCVRTSTQRKPTEEQRKDRAQVSRELLDAFRGKTVHTVFYHKYGCKVINALYFAESVPVKEKRRLFHEVAVPAVVSMARKELPGTTTLRNMLSSGDLSQENRDAMMSHLREAAEKAVDKELLGFDIVHLVFQAYCENASEEQLKDLAEKCMDGAPYLLSSKAGAEALLRLLGVANAKQRKALCRDLKGKFSALATNSVDYVVTMRIAATVDDTVLLAKTMLMEFGSALSEMCFDKYGHKVLAWIFRPDDPRFFDPYERKSLALPAPTAVKKPETRRQELVRTVKPQLRTVLLEKPLKAAADASAKNLLAAFLASDWDAEVVEALLAGCEQAASGKAPKEDGDAEDAESGELGLLETLSATRALKKLLELEPEDAEAPFAAPLWRRCLAPHLEAVAPTRCAALLLSLLRGEGKGLPEKEVASALRQKRSALEAAIKAKEKAGGTVTLAKQLLEVVDGGATKAAARKPSKAKAKAK